MNQSQQQRSDKTIFFHVGLPKTASTFLQRNVFPKFRGIRFIKKHDFKRRDQLIGQGGAERVLLSIELSLDHSGGIGKVKDVAAKYPHTYPIIVLRKHTRWLQSKYKYYLRKHGDRDFNGYFDLNGNGVLGTDNLLFFPKIKFLEEQFQHRPLVLFQEELKQNPYGVIDMLADYMGAEYNRNDIRVQTVKKSYNPRQLRMVRRFNRFYQYDHSGIRNKAVKFTYKKFSGLLLHSIAFFAQFFPEKWASNRPLIPQDKLKEIDHAYLDDWQKCIDYASQQRELLFNKKPE